MMMKKNVGVTNFWVWGHEAWHEQKTHAVFGLHQPPTGFSIQPGQANRSLNFPYKPHHSLQIFQLELPLKS